jgi:hypothetical protein
MSEHLQVAMKSRLRSLAMPSIAALVVGVALLCAMSPAGRAIMPGAVEPEVLASARFVRPMLAQEGGDEDDENAVPADQIEKYIGVYKAMQRDHSLTVEQATAKQGLSLDTFRDIERRVERDDLTRERVRDALRNKPAEAATQTAPSASHTPAPH